MVLSTLFLADSDGVLNFTTCQIFTVKYQPLTKTVIEVRSLFDVFYYAVSSLMTANILKVD